MLALREYLVFDSALRRKFLRTDPCEWPELTRQAVENHGQSYRRAIDRALEEGRISEEIAAFERRQVG